MMLNKLKMKRAKALLYPVACYALFVACRKDYSNGITEPARKNDVDNNNHQEIFAQPPNNGEEYLHRSLLMGEGSGVPSPFDEISDVPWAGIQSAQWCLAPEDPPLPYDDCKFDSFVFRFGVHGGLTNALHFLVKGALWAFEDRVCFYVDEEDPNPSKMAVRDPVEKSIFPFLSRYFEPIGVHKDSEIARNARKHHTLITPSYHHIQQHEFDKRSGGLQTYDHPMRHKERTLDILNMYEVDNILLKKIFLRRFFRIHSKWREIACSRLAEVGLNDEYIALSVRRGDKALEYGLVSDLQPYIDSAERAALTHFGGNVPTLFVASDDCGVMRELRDLRPDWNFVGECDHATEQNGFVIADMKNWTEEQTDAHYAKFITEMIAMASAKYWIGVSTTNVSFWIYFMRHLNARDDTYKFVDTDELFVH